MSACGAACQRCAGTIRRADARPHHGRRRRLRDGPARRRQARAGAGLRCRLFEAVLLNERVAPPQPKDYLTRYSGLRQGDLDDAPSFDSVQAKVKTLLDGRVLVGHSVSNDLKYLRLKHPAALTVDTAALNWGGREVGLANLAREVLGVDIQGATHCPEEDALTSLRLLKYHVAHGGPPPLRTVDVALEFAAAVPRAAVEPGVAAGPAEPPAADADADAGSAAGRRVPWSRASRGSLLRWLKKFGCRPARRRSSSRRRSRAGRGAVHRDAPNLKRPPSRAASTTTATPRLASAEAAAAAAAAAAAPPPRVQQLSEMVYRGGRDELARGVRGGPAACRRRSRSEGGRAYRRRRRSARHRRDPAPGRGAAARRRRHGAGVRRCRARRADAAGWKWACRCARRAVRRT